MEGAGRMTGEDIKTTWAGTNSLVPSIHEMGLAAQHNTLNNHWNGWNFRKIVGFRMSPLLYIYNILTGPLDRGIVPKTTARCFQNECDAK